MYDDFGGVDFLEDEMRVIVETIALELEDVDETDREKVMRDSRRIYNKGDSSITSYICEPLEKYL